MTLRQELQQKCTGRLKFCIWDVGKVIYDFSFQPLDIWCLSHTTDVALYESRRGQLDYDDYMRGEISFRDWCKRLCDFYAVPFEEQYVAEIDTAMQKGMSAEYPETRVVMEKLAAMGITNCILSNALPNLGEAQIGDRSFRELVAPEHRFCSYELGMLKPSPEIYQEVRRLLGVQWQEMVFIDDKIENVEGAWNVGLYAILYDKKTIADEINKLLKE